MKRVWKKPELLSEEFELSQHVAAGCDFKPGESIPVKPDEYITIGCVGYTGAGHWTTEISPDEADLNHDGTITWEEFTKVAVTARNNTITGGGHQNHNWGIIEGGPVGTLYNS